MSAFMWLWIYLYVVEILPIYRVLNILFMDVFMSWWHDYLRCTLFFRCDVLLLKFYACRLRIIWRRDIYFLNNCYICVFYRFNKSRALHSTPHEAVWWRFGSAVEVIVRCAYHIIKDHSLWNWEQLNSLFFFDVAIYSISFS